MKKVSLLPHFLRTAGQLTSMAAWQTGRLFHKAAASALEAIQEVLRAEIKKGNQQLVVDFLTNKALPAARALLLERMAARLLVRIGLRGVLASSVVGWILPFVLEQMMKVGHKTGVFEKIRTHSTVQDSLRRLDELKLAVWKRLAPDHGTSAELLDDDTELPRQLPS
ncbi:hypothetical protein KBK19_16235 [Microvirga sp. STR05]|uniref:DUF697 domain-containing protein n=1 Tax=Hymenobacter duratus TaxID=2771356 RepID=A0ABR8JLI9_9BACT|nr:hypothetical protein [Hymenobacter duratus]MBD2716593.1 hypothetical protein [Hymenobacter duratus]MBR7951508.1 hypothetical protein [Microvirga sp. STR05]